MHTTVQLEPESIFFKVEIAIEKLKRYKSSELIQARGNPLHSEIHKLINSIWHKEELLQ
jgi:hypothetical protein